MSVTQSARRVSAYEVVHASREFRTLRRRFSEFAVPAVVAFLCWYFLYVCCAAFAPGLMETQVSGDVNVGLCFGVGQFASTFLVTIAHLRWGRRRFDAQSTRLRVRLEQGRRR
ncbi:MAG: DUF485 domain-containing protein [Nocardiopsaceae bacterium]|nr:DUF485 domain-containing protein [Nocardiopsaceae bacterium]